MTIQIQRERERAAPMGDNEQETNYLILRLGKSVIEIGQICY